MANSKKKKVTYSDKYKVVVFDSEIIVGVNSSYANLEQSLKTMTSDLDIQEKNPDLLQKLLHKIGYAAESSSACSAEDLINHLASATGMYRLDGSRGIGIISYKCSKPVVSVSKVVPEKKTTKKPQKKTSSKK